MAASRRARATAACALAVAMIGTTVGPVGAEPTVTPVADGFAGPLGLAVSENGTIYVAEAFAGQLTSIDKHGDRTAIVSGLDWLPGVDARGNDVAFTYTEEHVDEEAEIFEIIETALVSINPSGQQTKLASLWDYEQQVNPDGDQEYGFLDVGADCLATLPPFIPGQYAGLIDSNPYAVAIDRGDHIVADAAGNSILRVRRNGSIETLAVLPPVPNLVDADVAAEFGLDECFIGETYYGEPVPTDVEVGPDGHYYVSTLPGQPELPGTAAVYRVHRSTGALTQVVDGLTMAVDLAVARDGTIYVAELVTGFDPEIGPVGQVTTIRGGAVVDSITLPTPGAVEVVRHGNSETLYATTGVFGPSGSLVTIAP